MSTDSHDVPSNAPPALPAESGGDQPSAPRRAPRRAVRPRPEGEDLSASGDAGQAQALPSGLAPTSRRTLSLTKAKRKPAQSDSESPAVESVRAERAPVAPADAGRHEGGRDHESGGAERATENSGNAERGDGDNRPSRAEQAAAGMPQGDRPAGERSESGEARDPRQAPGRRRGGRGNGRRGPGARSGEGRPPVQAARGEGASAQPGNGERGGERAGERRPGNPGREGNRRGPADRGEARQGREFRPGGEGRQGGEPRPGHEPRQGEEARQSGGPRGAGRRGGAPAEPVEPIPFYAEQLVMGADPSQPGMRPDGLPFEDGPKLHKLLADSGLGSRRDMEELIVSGRVSVNGQPAHVGQRIGANDQVRVNGRLLNRRHTPTQPRVLLYHKPSGEITSRDDPGQRATVFERLPKIRGARWVSVGRLDFNTEGLLVFTTSGELANRLMHPRYGWEREYAVRLIGRIGEEAKAQLLAGVQLEDGPAAFSKIDDVGGDGINHWYRVVIAEGRNREVRRMFESVGITVSRLVRIRFGPVGLPRSLVRGRWTELSDADVALLLSAIRRAGNPSAPGAEGDEDDFRARDDDFDDDDDVEATDDEWQPNSANAHLEGITREVRKGEPGAARGGARGRRGMLGNVGPSGNSDVVFTYPSGGAPAGARLNAPGGNRAGAPRRAKGGGNATGGQPGGRGPRGKGPAGAGFGGGGPAGGGFGGENRGPGRPGGRSRTRKRSPNG